MSSDPRTTLQAAFQQARQLHQAGKLHEAIAIYNKLVAIAPDSPFTLLSLGVALRATDRPAAAVVCYQRALAIDAENPVLHSNLGNALKDLGRFDEAVASHQRGLELSPDSAETYYNLGVALKAAGRLREALESFERAIALKPEHYDAQWDRALLLLHFGDTQQGWPAYESRWKLASTKSHGYAQPRWQGEPLEGRTLLLYPEQGFGDTIQMLRFLPSVMAAGGHVITVIQPELLRLARHSFPSATFIARGEPVPHFDLQCPLMSLPGVFQLQLAQLPGDIPYLKAPPEALEKFRQPLERIKAGLKIGIIWSGSITFAANHLRAVPISRFFPLMELPNTHFFSLQKGPTRTQLAEAGIAGVVTDLSAAIEDFADTAAAIEHLDMVIMTDSSVAHLTGALGKPIWNLLPYVADWRWLEEREDSPWYPSMRLLRQEQWDSWQPVFERVKQELIAYEKP